MAAPSVPLAASPSARFASGPDALAAATELYARYLAVADRVLSDGGADPDRLNEVLTGDALAMARADAAEFRAKGLRWSGTTRYRPPILQTYGPTSISLYVCEDVSEADLLDSSGKSLVTGKGSPLAAFEAHLTVRHDGVLLIAERLFWDGPGIC